MRKEELKEYDQTKIVNGVSWYDHYDVPLVAIDFAEGEDENAMA